MIPKLLILAIVFWIREAPLAFAQPDTTHSDAGIEFLPILSYDTDVGFGYGVKIFALNHLDVDESFDLVFFNSTKGERWYKLVFSSPDFERRQGTAYPFAVDVTIDYDKWIASSFFGLGNNSRYEDKETYTREPFEISVVLSRGFTLHAVGQIGLRYKIVRNFNVSQSGQLSDLSPAGTSRIAYASLVTSFRYDTRNSFINPSRGIVVSGELEYAPLVGLNDVSFTRLATSYQHYVQLPFWHITCAIRLGTQGLIGGALPVQVLLPVGGNITLRGSPQDRYLDKLAAVGNLELRFPLFWRFGGIAGFDAGKVWHSFSELDLDRWATNPTVGLRFYMDMFVVRLDVGLGKETTGFYLNFGHIF